MALGRGPPRRARLRAASTDYFEHKSSLVRAIFPSGLLKQPFEKCYFYTLLHKWDAWKNRSSFLQVVYSLWHLICKNKEGVLVKIYPTPAPLSSPRMLCLVVRAPRLGDQESLIQFKG
jgi:hypothetical protein